ncbi:folate-binding protein YgfZ [Synechococcus sp. NB0720_010]|uniref:CAF17-like 4Fe-4S cluster assembly/insertion protein YgfZ n=1 Tax=Synechococcus sp. NB0720_010 TaxID=2907159 RepID=UPI001FF971A5|nr:aminomethyltransferase [Synechococcus sp. NB0720_010]UPH89093.1 aminomethyltransferase [Synechococcus sp. NB0720_010]
MSAASRWGTPVSLIRLEGSDTRRFLHGQSSQAIELAKPGDCLPTCLISPTARMRGLALVCVDDTGADLIVIAGNGEAIRAGLDRVLFPADNVRLGAAEPATLWKWQGDAQAEDSVQLRPGVDLGSGADAGVVLQRSGEALQPWLADLPEWSDDQVEANRLRHGLPAEPSELNDDTNPFELGLANWVSLNKGCYVGQETLAKLATYDGVKQQLRYWESSSALEPGTTLNSAGGERAGVVTSSQGCRGLALIRRSQLEARTLQAGGTELTISTPLAFIAPPIGAGGQG